MTLDLRPLLDHEAPASVSIYLPTERTGPQVRQNPIRLDNLVSEARRELEALEIEDLDVEDLLAPATEMHAESEAWRDREDGLALLLAPGEHHRITAPTPFPSRVVCAPRFHLLPLIPLAEEDARFHVLALSPNAVSLYEGTHFHLRELPQGDIPRDMRAANWMDDPEPVLQQHATGRPSGGGRTRQQHHGHGGKDASADTDMRRFFRRVDRAVTERLAGSGAPLVLASDRGHLATYREVNTHPRLGEEAILGSPDRLDEEQLHAEAWKIVSAHARARRQEALGAYRQRAGTGTTTDGVLPSLRKAAEGRVDTLLFEAGTPIWGAPGDASEDARVHDERAPGDADLLDHTACETLRHGGRVLEVEAGALPDDTRACALLRH